jgi:hypothetical protein
VKREGHITDLPQGTVTLVFTDIEGSTRLLTSLGSRYEAALADHRKLLRAAFHPTQASRSTPREKRSSMPASSGQRSASARRLAYMTCRPSGHCKNITSVPP